MSYSDQQIVAALQVIDLLRETTGFGGIKAKYLKVLQEAEKEIADEAQKVKDAEAAKAKAEHEAMLAQIAKDEDSPKPPPEEPLKRPSDAFRRP